MPHSHPFADFGQHFGYAAVVTDPGHFEDIAATLDFSPQRVTPEAYLVSVLDIIEACASLADGVGYIAVPGFSVIGRQVDYVATARRIIATADEAPTCGWVIDLRLNTGGGYAPMVAGVGPILGDGPFLGWRMPDDRQLWVTYHNGGIYDDGRLVADELAKMPGYKLRHMDPPVAVLPGALTSSSGEVTTLAFLGRPETRLFGERTGGFTTGNASYFLFDGALLALAEVAMTDRTGATHMGGVMPDELIPTDWTTYGTDADPVLARATQWLAQQPACAAT